VYGICTDKRSEVGPICEFDEACAHFKTRPTEVKPVDVLHSEVVYLRNLVSTLRADRDSLRDELSGLGSGEFALSPTLIAPFRQGVCNVD
jgi:hypothetical protein